MSLKQRILSKVALWYAAREAARVSSGGNVYQPKTMKTNFHVSAGNRA
jgi:hypothetical protein